MLIIYFFITIFAFLCDMLYKIQSNHYKDTLTSIDYYYFFFSSIINFCLQNFKHIFHLYIITLYTYYIHTYFFTYVSKYIIYLNMYWIFSFSFCFSFLYYWNIRLALNITICWYSSVLLHIIYSALILFPDKNSAE